MRYSYKPTKCYHDYWNKRVSDGSYFLYEIWNDDEILGHTCEEEFAKYIVNALNCFDMLTTEDNQ